MAAHNETGMRGEEIAAHYLQKKGYQILDKNWRFYRNEIDIVARDGNILVVAEVKTRSSDKMMPPEMAVDATKRKAIIRSANAYVNYKASTLEVRFDIISILLRGNQPEINHIINAFYPTLI